MHRSLPDPDILDMTRSDEKVEQMSGEHGVRQERKEFFENARQSDRIECSQINDRVGP